MHLVDMHPSMLVAMDGLSAEEACEEPNGVAHLRRVRDTKCTDLLVLF